MQYKSKYVWALAGRFLPLLIYLATTVILARFLSPDDFGKVGVLSVFFVVANTLMDAGLGGSLVKEPHLTKLDCSTIQMFNIVVSHALYLILFIFSDFIEMYFNVDGLSSITKILCLIFVINSWGVVPRSLLTRDLKFKSLTIINVVAVLIAAVISVILAILDYGVYSLVAYQIVNGIVSVVLSIIVSHYWISFKFSMSSFKKLIPFGAYTTLSTTIDTLYENMITFFFGKYLNMQQAGFLYQAKRIEEVPSHAIASTISTVAFPVLTKLRADKLKFAEECNSIFKMVLLLTVPLLFTISIFAEPIICLIFGEQWQQAAPYLSLLIFAAIFSIAETLNRAFIKSTTNVALLMQYTFVKRIIGIAVILLCLLIDVSWILYGYVLSTGVGFVINAILLNKISEVKLYDQLKTFFLLLIPNILFYNIMVMVMKAELNIIFPIILCVFMLASYYLVVIRIYGFNLLSSFKKLSNN